MKRGIESSTRFLIRILWDIIKTPFILVLALFGRRRFSEAFRPLKDMWEFVREARFTFWMVAILWFIYLGSAFFIPEEMLLSLLHYPSDLFSIRIYTLITAGFLHADFAHIIGNTIALFLFGRVVESRLGTSKTMILYFGALILSGIFSSMVYLFYLGDNTPSLGASGAIMGLVSAAILLAPFNITYQLLIPMPLMVIGWIYIYADIIGIVSQADDNIGHFAHLFGFLSIAVLTYLMGKHDKIRIKKGMIINCLSLLIGLVIYALIYWI